MDPVMVWQRYKEAPILREGEVHLYRLRLDGAPDQWQRVLSVDETMRANRLLDLQKRNFFIAAHGQLRQILSSYLTLPPQKIIFQYGHHGKPSLDSSLGSNLTFNLSHSDNRAVVAVTHGFDIGVDIEKIDDQLNFHQLAERFFSEQEKSILQNGQPARKRRMFYRLWTAKESRLKVCGMGFSQSKTNKQSAAYGHHFYFLPRFVAAIASTGETSMITKYDFLS